MKEKGVMMAFIKGCGGTLTNSLILGERSFGHCSVSEGCFVCSSLLTVEHVLCAHVVLERKGCEG